METKLFMGIDPGQSGGMALISENHNGHVDFIMAFKDLTDDDLAEKFAWAAAMTKVAVLEDVHAFPGQGVSGMFRFGMSFGILRGLLAAYKIPRIFVTPQKWQKAMGVPPRGKKTQTEHKNLLKSMAQRLFPRREGITHAVSDALLLAEYCRRLKL